MFRKKSKNPANVQAPRASEDINKEFTDICAQIGFAEAEIYERELKVDSLKARVLQLGQEASLRQNLDRESAKNQPKESKDETVQP